jgi:hypothetical protein
MPLTAADITNAVRIYFSHQAIKLFKYEPYKKLINKEWIIIKDLGFPYGMADTVGWRSGDGKLVVCEVKTFTDRLSPTQKKVLNMIVMDGGLGFVAKATKDDNINIFKWPDMKVVWNVIECGSTNV